MADIKKYYYLKLKDNFFDSDAMIILESMENGYLYSNILMKMYLRSIKTDGRLMFNERIPYNANLLSKIVRHNVDVVEKAIKVFKELDLIEILDNGAIYMLDIQNYIGQSSTEADRKRLYRTKVNNEKLQIGQMSTNCPDITPPEIELEKEIELEIKKENKKKKTSLSEFIYLFDNLNIKSNKEDIYSLLKEYLEIRIKNKYVVNETVVKRLINKLNEYGTNDEEKIIIIENAINGKWKDFYPLKNKEIKPEWFNQDIKTTTASDEDIEKINKLLNEI